MSGALLRQFSNGGIYGSYRQDTYNQGVIFVNHCHADYEILTVFRGKISIAVEGKSYEAQEGSIFIFAPFVYHAVFSQTGGEYERISLNFTTDTLPEAIRSSFFERTKCCPVFAQKKNDFAQTAKKIALAKEKDYYYPLLHAELVRLAYGILDAAEPQSNTSEDDLCNRIVSYVNDNLEKPITLSQLANDLFLSQSTLCHCFKNRMKISIKQYVIQKKLSYASALLQKGVPAGEVAKNIGYQNYANFYSIYKQATGRSPTEAAK